MNDRPSQVVISLGSNIEPERCLPEALRRLRDVVTVLATSSVYESAPVGFTAQPPFCNAAALIETAHSPRVLKFEVLRAIESQLGRIRDPFNKNAPRTIDLDIALFGDWVVDEDDLTVPDPEIATRPFLAVPIAEVAPHQLHPVSGETLLAVAKRWGLAQQLTLRGDIVLTSALIE